MTEILSLTHTELLNLIAEKINAESYLEIGVFNPDHNFNKIVCNFKYGIDPNVAYENVFQGTSDEFFSKNIDAQRWDLILIDGLHHADQVKEDIKNSFACLSEKGVILIHDSNPPTEQTTCVPRGSQREWCGDVYKTICQITSPKFTIDVDYGCCVLQKKDGLKFNKKNIDWNYFNKNRKELLNLVSLDEGLNLINNLC